MGLRRKINGLLQKPEMSRQNSFMCDDSLGTKNSSIEKLEKKNKTFQVA
jgi:hypothetical protein